jgi:poly-gamma-glutamate synthesis protein (capsule biosynthesis protein)
MTAIVSERTAPTHTLLTLILLGFFLVGCSIQDPVATKPLEPPPKDGPPTPADFLSPTPFQGGALWVSPSLPLAFTDLLNEELLLMQGFELVEDLEEADTKIASGIDDTVSTWVYSLVAPFPTTVDGLTWKALRALWSGDEGSVTLLVGASSLTSIEALLGPAGEAVRIEPEGRLIDIAWELGAAYAIIPFESLEPRWKVLELDGQAPIRTDFDLESYQLKVGIGVAGPVGAAERLIEVLQIPTSNYDPDRMTVLVMTGVTALTRATAWQMDMKGVGFPAEKIGDWLLEADLTHISNEAAFSEDCPPPDPSQAGLKFCSDPSNIELLEIVGTDIVELTGNHVRDYGSDALAYTLEEYRNRGWGIFGGGESLEESFEPYLVGHNGNKLAFLGCNQAGPKFAWALAEQPGSTPCEMDRLFDKVGELSELGNTVIFTYQWGEGSVVMEAQRKAFEAAVDAGATIVNGSQAHHPLGMTFYEDGFIHYGLGNLFFDQMQTLNLRSELIDRHVIYDGRYISTELLTAMLESYAQPRPMTTEERSLLLGRIFEASEW